MSYYEVIDGVKYDKSLLDIVKKSVEGQGDGRISQNDIIEISKFITDKNKITKTEYQTIFYCIKNFKFTDQALEVFADILSK
jgi:hypothetical protein